MVFNNSSLFVSMFNLIRVNVNSMDIKKMYVNVHSHIHFDDFISMLVSREKEISSYV